MDFGRALAPIRARVAEDLEREGMLRERVLAAVVQLLESTCLRVGNEAYRRASSDRAEPSPPETAFLEVLERIAGS